MAADKRKYLNPRRNLPGVKLPDAPTQAVEARTFELLRGFEFTDHLQWTLEDSAQPHWGNRGPFFNKLTANDDTAHAITWAIEGVAHWGLGEDDDESFSLYDHTAGTRVLRFSLKEDDTLSGSASPKAILSYQANSPAALTAFFTVEAGSTLDGLNVSVANSTAGRNSLTLTQRDANHFSTVNFDGAYRIIVDSGKANTSTFTLRDDAAAADRMTIDASGNVVFGGTLTFTDLTATGSVTFSKTPTATSQRGVVSIGDGGFTGGAGHFAGSASGAYLAVNANSTFAGDMLRYQKNGLDRWRCTNAGVALQTTWDAVAADISYPYAIRHGVNTGATGGSIGIGSGIGFEIESSTPSTFVNLAAIAAQATAVGSGTQTGKLLFQLRSVGTLATYLTLATTGLTLNTGVLTAGNDGNSLAATTFTGTITAAGITATSLTDTGLATFSQTPTASANFGVVSIGDQGFAGGGGTNFLGSVNGTGLAMNLVAGFTGNLIDLQTAGTQRFVVGAGSTVNVNKMAGLSSPLTYNSVIVTYTSDANKTLALSEYVNPYIDIQTDAVLTATRDLIVPLGIGEFFIVRNRNAQAIRVIGASGTGTTIASGRIAILAGSGSNIIRVTADATP